MYKRIIAFICKLLKRPYCNHDYRYTGWDISDSGYEWGVNDSYRVFECSLCGHIKNIRQYNNFLEIQVMQ